MRGEQPYVAEDTLHQGTGSFRIPEGDVVGNGIEVAEGGLGPDHFNHRDMRRFASA